jgi:LysM repeat protein
MKKQLNQLRRFFARTGARKLNAATAREVIPASYDDDDSSNRLSGAFIVVLVLHVIALVGVFAFSRMKDPKVPSGGGNQSIAQGAPAAGSIDRSEAPAPAPVTVAAIPSAPAAQYASLQSQKHPAIAAAESAAPSERAVPESPRAIVRGSGHSPYIVKNGDNLTKIAVAYGVRSAELMSTNNLKSADLKPGQELVIPESKTSRTAAESKTLANPTEKAAASKTTPGTYKVQKNETLVKIARVLKVDYDDLTKLNGIKDPKKLQEGQVLKVPKR